MADRRSVSPGLLAHPIFRRATLIERETWIGLILVADDEGRLRMDLVPLAEAIFSPLTHKVTAKKLKDALDFWSTAHDNGKPPWLMVYGDGAYGFLTGWYEHQLIRDELREVSSLPAPPVPVNSWLAADAVYRWYCREKKQKKTYTRLAIRALSSLTVAQQTAIIAEELRNSYTTVQQQLRVEGGCGVEGCGEGGCVGGETPPAQLGHMEACHSRIVASCVAYFHDIKAPEDAQEYGLSIVRQLKAENAGITAEAVL